MSLPQPIDVDAGQRAPTGGNRGRGRGGPQQHRGGRGGQFFNQNQDTVMMNPQQQQQQMNNNGRGGFYNGPPPPQQQQQMNNNGRGGYHNGPPPPQQQQMNSNGRGGYYNGPPPQQQQQQQMNNNGRGGYYNGPPPQQQQQQQMSNNGRGGYHNGPPPPPQQQQQMNNNGRGGFYNGPPPPAFNAYPHPNNNGAMNQQSHNNGQRQLNNAQQQQQAPPAFQQPEYNMNAHNGVNPPPQSPLFEQGSPSSAASPFSSEDPMVQKPRCEFDEAMLSEFEAQYQALCEDVVTEAPSIDLQKCLQVIDASDVTFVVTDTGSGKSSLLPKHILEAYPESKIISSQTRRTAAVSLANRVADLSGEKVGENIGYFVRGDHVGDLNKTRLMYITSYLLFLHIVGNPTDVKATHIIIDEFHERTPDIEITLSLLRMALKRGLKFKIILLSATVDTESWEEYFSGCSVGKYDETVPRFQINSWYMDEIHKLVKFDSPTVISAEEIDSSVRTTTCLGLYMMMRELLALLATRCAVEHAILVFLPGRTEISKTRTWIETFFQDTLDPIEWYADIDLDKIQEHINRRPTDNRKKVYLATDIAEVSVTVPDVVFIIDCGLSRKPRINERDANTVAFPALETVGIMRTAARQRMGRVGRVRQGFYFSLLSRQTLPFLRAPEGQIVNAVLDTLTLHVLQMTENPKTVFERAATQPKDSSLRLSLLKLLDNGAIMKASQQVAMNERRRLEATQAWRKDYDGNDQDADEEVITDRFFTTAKGQVIQFLPLKVCCADLVFWGMLTGIAELAVLAACVAEVGSPFYTSTGTRKPTLEDLARTRASMLHYSKGRPSDIVASVAICAEYKAIMDTTSEEARQQWCVERNASASRLEQIFLYERSVLDAIADRIPGITVKSSPDVITQQIRESADTLDLLIGIAFSMQSIWVENDAAHAQKKGFVGSSLFMRLRALKDQNAASTCAWPRKTIVVPTSLRLMSRKLLGNSAVQFDRAEFNALTLCTSADIVFAQETVPSENGPRPTGLTICRYSRQGRTKFCRIPTDRFANGVLVFREAVCIQMNEVFLNVGDTPTEETLQKAYTDRGVVADVSDHKLLPRFIARAMSLLVKAGVEDIPWPGEENPFVPTHRSLLRAGGKTSVMPYSAVDDIEIAITATEHEIIED